MKTATCYIGGRLRINIPVVKENARTVWIKTLKRNGWGREIPHIVKIKKKHLLELKGD